MNQTKIIGTAVLLLLLGATASVYAKKGGGGQKAQHTQQQRGQHAQQAQRSQRTQQAQRGGQQRQRAAYNRGNNGFHGNGNNGNHYGRGRISANHFRANFGRDHSFRINRRMMADGHQRFQYNGYWFGYSQPWPVGWNYYDDVYVDYVGGGYYMYNPRHPGIQISLNLF